MRRPRTLRHKKQIFQWSQRRRQHEHQPINRKFNYVQNTTQKYLYQLNISFWNIIFLQYQKLIYHASWLLISHTKYLHHHVYIIFSRHTVVNWNSLKFQNYQQLIYQSYQYVINWRIVKVLIFQRVSFFVTIVYATQHGRSHLKIRYIVFS